MFPECILTGYDLTPDEAQSYSVSSSGETITRIHEACKDLKLTVQVGALEHTHDGVLFNSVFLLGPDKLHATYRKTHLPHLGVDRFISPGGLAPTPVSTPLGRLGSLICFDLRFPEPSRLLALGGAQLILVSTAWPRSARLYTDFLAQARAAENRVFLLAANRCGVERSAQFLGHSMIIHPDGQVLQEAGGEAPTILFAEIDPVEADQKHIIFNPGIYELDLLGARRPELYLGLFKPHKAQIQNPME